MDNFYWQVCLLIPSLNSNMTGVGIHTTTYNWLQAFAEAGDCPHPSSNLRMPNLERSMLVK